MSRPDEPQDEGGFFSGWSKRKLAAKRQNTPGRDVEAVPETQAESDPVPADVEQEDIDDAVVAALPPLEGITAGSDIKPFLAKGVPAKLKNAAMRRLWMATPGVRDYSDPAVDYAWDWNAPGGVPGGGGTLSETGVAKMVKDLIGGRNDPPPEESVEAAPIETESVEQVASEAVEQSAAVAEDDVPPSPVRRSDAGTSRASLPPPGTGSDEATREDDAPAKSLPPPRRHGGAVPD
jgi:hypothetical protein